MSAWMIVVILGGVFALVLLALYLLLGPITRLVGGGRLQSLPDEKRLEAENAIRQTLVHAAGGILLAGTLAASALAAKQSFETLDAQRDAQVTDRYAAAVERLGDESASARAAAVFALGRIYHDSVKDRDAIVQALSASVRHHAKPPAGKEGTGQEKTEPAVDVEAALLVLGRRDRTGEKYNLRLEDVHLRNARLYALKLPETFFNGADLAGVRARGVETDLRNADFSETNLTCADLGSADLSSNDPKGGGSSQKTNLMYANLRGANLAHTKLRGAMMRGADLRQAHLEGADLSDVTGLKLKDLEGAFTDDRTTFPRNLVITRHHCGREFSPCSNRAASAATKRCPPDRSGLLAPATPFGPPDGS